MRTLCRIGFVSTGFGCVADGYLSSSMTCVPCSCKASWARFLCSLLMVLVILITSICTILLFTRTVGQHFTSLHGNTPIGVYDSSTDWKEGIGPWPKWPERVEFKVWRGDNTVWNPHRAQNVKFEFFQLILLLKLDKQFPVEQFEATVS